MKAVVAAFNQEKALVGAFSVITNLRMELFEALNSNLNLHLCVTSGRVTREHDGVYTCTAHNGVGGSQGAAANISLTVGGVSSSTVSS